MKIRNKKNCNLLFQIDLMGHSKTNAILLRLHLMPEHTKVDFGYSTGSIYTRGGWIKMAKETFIENVTTQKRYKMIEAAGITIAPKKHNFTSNKDWKYYSLFFEPIPIEDCTLNLIEKEKGTLNDFNYYGIQLKMSDGVEVK